MEEKDITITCKECAVENSKNAKFCYVCGTNFNETKKSNPINQEVEFKITGFHLTYLAMALICVGFFMFLFGYFLIKGTPVPSISENDYAEKLQSYSNKIKAGGDLETLGIIILFFGSILTTAIHFMPYRKPPD